MNGTCPMAITSQTAYTAPSQVRKHYWLNKRYPVHVVSFRLYSVAGSSCSHNVRQQNCCYTRPVKCAGVSDYWNWVLYNVLMQAELPVDPVYQQPAWWLRRPQPQPDDTAAAAEKQQQQGQEERAQGDKIKDSQPAPEAQTSDEQPVQPEQEHSTHEEHTKHHTHE